MSSSSQRFDPIYITCQILALQCSYYLAMGTIWGLFHVFLDHPVSLDHFFTENYIGFFSLSEWVDAFCTFLSGVAGYVILLFFLNHTRFLFSHCNYDFMFFFIFLLYL